MTRHLLYGGCGFIGRHVALMLHTRGDEVILADVVQPQGRLAERLPVGFRPVDPAGTNWEALIEGVDVIHYLAWTTIPSTATQDPLRDFQDNLGGLVRLLEVLRRRHDAGQATPKLVFTSSGGTVYGPIRQVPVPESHPFDPINAYGASKASAEIYLNYFGAAHGLDYRVARISNPYGAGQSPTRGQGAASTFLHKALAGAPISIWGDGSVVRDYIHIADLAAALVALADARSEVFAGPEKTRALNIGSGVGVSLNDILAVIRDELTLNVDVTYTASRGFDVPVSVLDISNARRLLNWAPQLDFAAGYRRTHDDLKKGDGLFSTLGDTN